MYFAKGVRNAIMTRANKGTITKSRKLLSGEEILSMRRKPIKQVVRQDREVVSSHERFVYFEMTERRMIEKKVARAEGAEFFMIWNLKLVLTRL